MSVKTKDELIASVKEQISKWDKTPPDRAYNTGAMGNVKQPYNWSGDSNIVPKSDFNEACSELKIYVQATYSGYTVSYAASGSLRDYGVWDILVEPYNQKPPKMNYHIKVTG